jgi:hypothetical protein
MWLLLIITLLYVCVSIEIISNDVKYGNRALERFISSTETRCVGISCIDGVLLALVGKRGRNSKWVAFSEKMRANDQENEEDGDDDDDDTAHYAMEVTRCLDPSARVKFGKCIYMLEEGMYVALTGWQADAVFLLRHVQETCLSHRSRFGTTIGVKSLAEEVARFLYSYSVERGATRPLVVSALLSGYDHGDGGGGGGGDGDGCARKPRATASPRRLYKVDSAGHMHPFSRAITGPPVASDLAFLTAPEEEEEEEEHARQSERTKGRYAKGRVDGAAQVAVAAGKEESEDRDKDRDNGSGNDAESTLAFLINMHHDDDNDDDDDDGGGGGGDDVHGGERQTVAQALERLARRYAVLECNI